MGWLYILELASRMNVLRPMMNIGSTWAMMMAGIICKVTKCHARRESKALSKTHGSEEHDEDPVLQVCNAVTEFDESQSNHQGDDAM